MFCYTMTEKKIKKKVRFYSYDILVESTNLLIEVNGDYWHGNPKIYKPNDLILKGSTGEIKVSNKWKKDAKKIQAAKDAGYNVLVVWESDWKTEPEKTKNKILEKIYESKRENQNNQET